MADNWYVILELEFDPPIEDEQEILKRIDEKVRFWSTHFNDFRMGPQYRAWHQNIPRIKKDMLGPNNIREELAREACKITYDPVDRLLKTIGRKGYITTNEGDKLSKRLKISLDIVKKRSANLGLRWVQGSNTDYQAIYDKYYKIKPKNAPVFDGIGQMLSTFNVDNLYDFLYADTGVKNANRLPCGTLRQRAAEKKKKEFFKNDSVSGTGSKLCGQCELAFKDESSKDIYDKYLEYSKVKGILEDAKSIAEISGELTSIQAEEIANQLTHIFRDRELSNDILTAFCRVERIIYNTAQENIQDTNIKVCRCGSINDISDGRKICKNCGLELVIMCPKCKTHSDANIGVCKCGFRFENIDRAIALCEQAEYAINSLEFEVAQAHLKDANDYWPKSDKISSLRNRLREREAQVGREMDKIHTAIKAKRYIEARGQYNRIQGLFPSYGDVALKEQIDQAITRAEDHLKQAEQAHIQSDVLKLCTKAYSLCSDLPGVKDLIPPPPEIQGLTVSTNPDLRTNIVSWTPTNDRSIRSIVVRSTHGWPRDLTEGKIIYKGSAVSYSDRDIEPATTYYYNVFAERAGVHSKGAKGEFKEIVNLFEITKVSIAPGDGSLNLSWDSLPVNAVAKVYKVLDSGLEKLLTSSSSDSYLISNLENDRQYNFRVALSYIVAGREETTRGIGIGGTPTYPPEPIDTLRINPIEEGVFESIWIQKETDDVRLFASTERPNHKIGDLVSLANLEQKMKPLQQRPLSNKTRQELKPNEQGATFQHFGSECLYVVAVAVKSNSAIFGSIARASVGENVNIKTIRPVNGKINISLDLPKGATGFVVLYRFDQFPTDISDVNTIRRYIPLKQYQLDSAIVLDILEERKYFFSVFAEYQVDGEREYSTGTDYLFDNSAKDEILYSINVNRRLFGPNIITLEFQGADRQFTLPDIEIMSAVGNTPMFKSSGKLFHTVEAQEVDGSMQVQIPIPKGTPRDTYIKAFIRDDSAQLRSQLRLKLKSNYKIT